MNTKHDHSLEIGTVLNGKWVVLEFLGRGAMGEVYRAHQLNLKRDAAIKVISPEWIEMCDDDAEEIAATFQRFQREVETMAAIRHQNVLQIIDYDSTTLTREDQPIDIDYIVMEYIPGSTLRSTMTEEGLFPDERATKTWLADYFLPVLQGVKAIHDVGIVHRDLKPENVLMDGETPKIADFGLARSQRLRTVTQSADSKGTPPYMAPEQFLDFKRADKRADIYSLGKILFEAIEGKMTSKTALPFQCVRLRRTTTPFFEKLDELLCEATAEKEDKRLASTKVFQDRILDAMNLVALPDAEENGVPVRETPGQSPVKPSFRFSRPLSVLGLLAVAVSILLLWMTQQDGPVRTSEPISPQETASRSLSTSNSLGESADGVPGADLNSALAVSEPDLEGMVKSPDSKNEFSGAMSEGVGVPHDPDPFPLIEAKLDDEGQKSFPSPEALEKRKTTMQDRKGGVPDDILQLQAGGRVIPPSLEDVGTMALEAAQQVAEKFLDNGFHKGRRHLVPDAFQTIQSAIDVAKPGDVVVVKAGRYFESIVLKDGVKVESESGNDGDKKTLVEGGQVPIPTRTLRTIIDGSKAKGSTYWIVSCEEGAGHHTILDGFTIEHLPVQDHLILSNSYAIDIHGASPIIMNCYVRKNASMGVGNHVVYERSNMRALKPKRHAQEKDVKRGAGAIIYRNIICQNLGLGIQCDPFSTPHILGNELFLNVFPYRDEYGQKPSPGIEARQGSIPQIIGNVVHNQPGEGIRFDACVSQGSALHPSQDEPTLRKNVIYANGENGLSILCSDGTARQPVRCAENWIYETGWTGIDLAKGALCIVEDNTVYKCGAPGIKVDGASVVRLNRNKVTGANGPGFIVKNGGTVREMLANVSDLNKGPRFVLRNGKISRPDG